MADESPVYEPYLKAAEAAIAEVEKDKNEEPAVADPSPATPHESSTNAPDTAK